MLKYVLPLLLFSTTLAHADTARGYFNEKGEAVVVYKDGEKVEGMSFPMIKRKPSSIHGPDTDMLYFQDDGSTRCYYHGKNLILSCVRRN